MTKLKPHPDAELFPMFSDEALESLTESIRKDGLDVPIVLYQGMILDGRNRYLACQKAGIEPRFTTYEGDDPLEKVQRLNAERRDMTPPQRAITAAKVYERMLLIKASPSNGRLTFRALAARYKISQRTFQEARELLAEAPDLAEQVSSGTIPFLTRAYDELQSRRKAAERRAADARRISKYTDAVEAGELSVEEALQKAMDDEREEQESLKAEADARHHWLKEFLEAIDWIERFVGQLPDERFAWHFQPGAPGSFDHGITADRLRNVVFHIQRVRESVFAKGNP